MQHPETFLVINPKDRGAGPVVCDSIAWPTYQAAGWIKQGAPEAPAPSAQEAPEEGAPEAPAPRGRRKASQD